MEVGKKEITYLSLHFYHQNDSCIKVGNDESHFNVLLIVRDKITRQCPQTTFEEKESRSDFEPSSLCLLIECLTARPNWLTDSFRNAATFIPRVLVEIACLPDCVRRPYVAPVSACGVTIVDLSTVTRHGRVCSYSTVQSPGLDWSSGGR